jgi:hypothetical protein
LLNPSDQSQRTLSPGTESGITAYIIEKNNFIIVLGGEYSIYPFETKKTQKNDLT